MSRVLAPAPPGPRLQRSPWRERYGCQHGYVRLHGDAALPNGRRGRVTLYQRGAEAREDGRRTYILSWCVHGRRHKQRVTGDVYDAVRRADEINAAINGDTTTMTPHLAVEDLVARFIDALHQRAEAGEISSNTPSRYRAALHHLVTFSTTRDRSRVGRQGWTPTRNFTLQFKAYLHGARISPNGHPKTPRRPIAVRGIEFILSASRALVRWAAREGHVPAMAVDAFAQTGGRRVATAILSTTPIRTDEVVSLIRHADRYQLALFSFHIFHGARVAEPCWLMLESVDWAGAWIEYHCIDELGYRTKGGTNKRLPMPRPMREVLALLTAGHTGGPIMRKRWLARGRPQQGARQLTFRDLVRIVEQQTPANCTQRTRAGRAALQQAGGITGDDVRREFARLIRQASLHTDLRPKALRHHFATALEHADIPYYTRKYLLGHTTSTRGRHVGDPTAVYTHLDAGLIQTGYQRLLDGPLSTVAGAFAERVAALQHQSPGD